LRALRIFFTAYLARLLYIWGNGTDRREKEGYVAMNDAVSTKTVPASHLDLLERPLLMVLGTTMPDGTSRVTPVWFNYEDGYIFMNSVLDTAKHRAISAHPYVSLVVIDPDNPFRYLTMRGSVVEVTEEGANEHVRRAIYKIAPAHVATKG
jgi:hypothetical protein